MGADYTDIDVVSDPLTSSDDFVSRAPTFWKEFERSKDEQKALVVLFLRVKEEIRKSGADIDEVILRSALR